MSAENHTRFLTHLSESDAGVWLAARWLHSIGYNVKVNCASKAAKHEDWKKHTDNGDLEISQRVEVKNLSIDFTCRNDWPYGDNFIVCAKHAWDNAVPKPFGFIYLSKSQSHAAVLKGDTSGQWIVSTRKDSRYQGDYSQEFYFAPLELVKFFQINKN